MYQPRRLFHRRVRVLWLLTAYYACGCWLLVFRVGRRFESTFILIPMLAVRELSHWSSLFLRQHFMKQDVLLMNMGGVLAGECILVSASWWEGFELTDP